MGKRKEEAISWVDVITQSDRYVNAVSKRTKRSPMAHALLMHQFSVSPLTTPEAKKMAKEASIQSRNKVAGKILEQDVKDYFS